MGFGSSKAKTEKKEKPLKVQDLQNLLIISQKRCILQHNKKINSIRQKEDEIIESLKQNNMDLAVAKMDNLLKDEDYITVYKILDPILEILKEKSIYIISNSECPAELRAPLDTVLYAATRLEIEELMKFREKIIQKYGIAYVTKAQNNEDKFVNPNIEEKLKITVFSQEMKKIRIKQLCQKKNFPYKFEDDIAPGPQIEVIDDRNPYESMRPNTNNLPTQSFVQKHSGNIDSGPYPTFGPSQGGFQDGFPRQDQGNNQGGFPQPSPYDQNQSNFPQPSNYVNNNNYPPSTFVSNNQINESDDIFTKTLKTSTIPIPEQSPSKEQSQTSNNNNSNNPYASNFPQSGSKSAMPPTNNADNIFPEESSPTVYYSQNAPKNPQINQQSQSSSSGNVNNMTGLMTNQTMSASIANPNNVVNPYENTSLLSQKGGSNNNKINEPQDIFDPNAKIKNPFDVSTLPLDEDTQMKSISQPNPSNSNIPAGNNNSLKQSEGVNPSDTNVDDKSPLDIPTVQVDDLNKMNISGKDPFDPNAKIKNPFDVSTLPLDEGNNNSTK